MKPEKERLTESCGCRVIFRDGRTEIRPESLLTEYHLTIRISRAEKEGSSGRPEISLIPGNCTGKEELRIIRTVCTPQHLQELITGRLCTEGLISAVSEICRMDIFKEEGLAECLLKPAKDGYGAAFSGETPEWSPEEIFALADSFRRGTELHRRTGAAHSCFISCRGRIVFQCEDIGRHNALDKAVGFLLREEINPRLCIAYTSGRMPEDMVRKAVRAGIPVLAGKASPTPSAVRLAQRSGLVLIGAARSDSIKIFCDGRT